MGSSLRDDHSFSAYTLKCYECIPGLSGFCTDTAKQCPSQDYQCGAVKVTTYTGGSKESDISMKNCALAQECVEGSINFGVTRTTSKSSPNGKKCFTCDGQKCTATLNCEGNEDYCISTTVSVGGGKTTVKGCASKMMCVNTQTAQMTAAIGAEMSCCQGDYCNSASSTSAGLLLLVAPLISLVVFS
ncbi:urokinase plasminogen activator surface receptor-like isoform X1 [Lates japonicus]|uniref:Urokinase plasminogen activator surface receptor-like isoform X1 n=1 Tax=Lates japonicus TaxID=270547 RepID=A0AAD3MHF3_LATJO|nr:urokinase plasminogen activator surface receptor-like isoform X1 [Lates japonicus]